MATTIQQRDRVLAAPRPAKRQPSPPSGHFGARVALYIVLTVLGVVAALPFVWMILSSFKPEAEIRQIPPTFWPERPSLDSYRTILRDPELPLLLFYRNSAFVAIMNVAFTLFTW